MLISGRPQTWNGIIRQRSRFDVLVNDAMASLMKRGIEPSKRQICHELGLDYGDADDRARVTQSISQNRQWTHYAWNLWVESPEYNHRYQRVADDSQSFLGWKTQKAELYDMMKRLGMSESDVHQLWILSRLWEMFLLAANKWNLHIFVAFGHPWQRDGFRYRQPNYWDYIANQVEVARRLCKGTLTILERHRDFGMMLTSGTEVEIAIQTAKDTLQMIADGEPTRFKCEQCASQGIVTAFRTQAELVEHYRQKHNV
jgi:hypothetical protein